MIAVDTNLLVYAHRLESPLHGRARHCIATLAASPTAWAIPWHCLHEFFAVVTNKRAFVDPMPASLATRAIDALLASPSLHLLHETASHWRVLRDLIASSKAAGPMVHDARIAAVCLQHGVRELWSADRDFRRFAALKVHNPLAG